MDYAKKKIMADKLLKKNGSLITLTRYESTAIWTKDYDQDEMRYKWTDGEGNVVHEAPVNTPTEYKKYGVRTSYKLSEIDGTLIKRGDVRLVLSTDFPEPKAEDKFTVAGVSYSYVDLEPKAPADIPIVYIVQVRK